MKRKDAKAQRRKAGTLPLCALALKKVFTASWPIVVFGFTSSALASSRLYPPLDARTTGRSVIERFSELAGAIHRNAEAHIRFLIEWEVSAQPADTCGEILDLIWSTPALEVDLKND